MSNSPYRVTTILLAIGLSSLFRYQSFAQVSDSMKTELRKISRTIYDEGNPNYLDIDAVCDDLVLPGQWYHLAYEDGLITINGKEIKVPLNRHYAEKMKYFVARCKNNVDTKFTTTSDGLKLNDVFDEHSVFRQRKLAEYKYYRNSAYNKVRPAPMAKLVKWLVGENLVDTTRAYEIKYNKEGLWLNKKKQDNKTTARCAAMLKQEGFELKGDNDELYTKKEP